MTTRGVLEPLPFAMWALGAVAGVVAGLAVVVPVGYLVAGGAAALAALALVRSDHRSELIVGAYWITFCVFSTVLADFVPAGMFYPFYVALLLGAVVALAVDRITFHPFVAWTYVAFMVVLVRSLVGFTESLGGDTLDRLVVVPFGALIVLQFRSARGVRPVAVAAVLASLAVSVWVVWSAVEGGFAYRGNIDANENVVSFYVALGFVAAFAERLHRRPLAGAAGQVLRVALLMALATMAYALVLLASRGMIIGLALALLVMAVRIALHDRRRLIAFAALFALVPVGLLLPGGRGIVERFENPSTATGGGRTQIWAAVGASLAQAGTTELALGHGFGASDALVQRNFASLRSTHNAYLQVLYDLGVVGLVLFLALHAYAFQRSWSVPGASGALMLGLVTFLLGANLFMSTPDNFLYWTALGFVLAIGTWARDGGAPSVAPRMSAARDPARPEAPHVVFVLASLALGGAESQLTSMLEAVAGRPDGLRASVLTLTARHDPSLVRRLAVQGVPVATVDRAAASFPAFFLALVRWFRDTRPALVHTILSGSTGTWGRLAARVAGVPIIVHSERSLAPRRTRWQRALEPLAHRFTTRFLTNARAIADRLEGEGVARDRIRVLRNGVDLTRFTAGAVPLRSEWGVGNDGFVVGYLGSLRPIKRPDLLLDAVALLPRADRPDLVVFGGDGPLLPTLRARVGDDPWARDHVRLLGQVGDVPSFLAALDVLALTSDTEGLPNAIIEAMAAAVPCVATRVSDVPDLVTDNGFVVSPGDADGFAAALARMRALDPEERRAMGRRGRARAASEYALEVAAKRFWEVHRELLEAEPGRPGGGAARG